MTIDDAAIYAEFAPFAPFAPTLEEEYAAVLAAQAAPEVAHTLTTTTYGPYDVRVVCANCGPLGAGSPAFAKLIADNHPA